MSRERLPNRRSSVSFTFEAADALRYTATFSRFADGRVADIFLNNHRVNSQSDVNARDAAVVASICLQHGGDIDTIRKALMRNADGAASGPLGRALDLICGIEK
jgi:hypothetical protein